MAYIRNPSSDLVMGGTPSEPLQESIKTKLRGAIDDQLISPGCEVITFIHGTSSAGLRLGIYRGLTRKIDSSGKFTTEYYIIERDDGKLSRLFYANFVKSDTPLKSLSGIHF